MKTSDLINSLSENLAPTRAVPLYRYLAASLVVGTVLALALSLSWLGPRAIDSAPQVKFVFAKISFAASIIVSGALLVMHSSVPGRAKPGNYVLVIFPIALFALLGFFELMHADQHWHEKIFGADWLLCLFAIPLIASAPYALMVVTIRTLAAPTDLRRAGAFVGMTSGGISALSYALHCTDDSVLFVGSWYVTAIALCTIIGGFLGPRILRW